MCLFSAELLVFLFFYLDVGQTVMCWCWCGVRCQITAALSRHICSMTSTSSTRTRNNTRWWQSNWVHREKFIFIRTEINSTLTWQAQHLNIICIRFQLWTSLNLDWGFRVQTFYESANRDLNGRQGRAGQGRAGGARAKVGLCGLGMNPATLNICTKGRHKNVWRLQETRFCKCLICYQTPLDPSLYFGIFLQEFCTPFVKK